MSKHKKGAKGKRHVVSPISIAAHEAGHIVSYLSFGVRILEASIKEDVVERFGDCYGHTSVELNLDATLRNLAIIAMAGCAAESLTGVSEEMLESSSWNDYTIAEGLISQLTTSEEDTATVMNSIIIPQTCEFVREHLAEIAAFTEVLLEEKELDEARILEIWDHLQKSVS